jgi:TRAP-type C4-dicarboxylate transport system permease large subunit
MHYALVLIIAMGIGGFMPLAGVGFYVCCAIMRWISNKRRARCCLI